MSTSLRDLNRRADALTPPSFDIDDIVATGDTRIGRRRVALATGTAALVAAVVAASTTFTGPSKQSNPPLDGPTPSVTETSATETSAPTPTRQLTYADVPSEQAPNWRIRSIQYGDQTLRLGVVLHMDVTDDGLAVLAEDGTIYFSDGSSVERIGQTSIEVSFSDADVKAASAGSLLAWFGPADRDRSLVVYDTHKHRVVAQVPVTGCVPGQCRLVTVVGNRVYWSESDPPPTGQPLRALDVSTSTVSETDAAGLSAYLRGFPRGFVKGDSYADGDVATQDVNPEGVFFAPVGSSLELRRLVRETSDEPVYDYGGFDTTGRRLHLRLPSGYTPAASDYTLFQWIDDDRFAVMAGAAHNEFGWNGFPGYGDILVCDISRERCTVVAKGPSDDGYRIVPHLDVPN
jgi:hypothetical protein